MSYAISQSDLSQGFETADVEASDCCDPLAALCLCLLFQVGRKRFIVLEMSSLVAQTE